MERSNHVVDDQLDVYFLLLWVYQHDAITVWQKP